MQHAKPFNSRLRTARSVALFAALAMPACAMSQWLYVSGGCSSGTGTGGGAGAGANCESVVNESPPRGDYAPGLSYSDAVTWSKDFGSGVTNRGSASFNVSSSYGQLIAGSSALIGWTGGFYNLGSYSGSFAMATDTWRVVAPNAPSGTRVVLRLQGVMYNDPPWRSVAPSIMDTYLEVSQAGDKKFSQVYCFGVTCHMNIAPQVFSSAPYLNYDLRLVVLANTNINFGAAVYSESKAQPRISPDPTRDVYGMGSKGVLNTPFITILGLEGDESLGTPSGSWVAGSNAIQGDLQLWTASGYAYDVFQAIDEPPSAFLLSFGIIGLLRGRSGQKWRLSVRAHLQ